MMLGFENQQKIDYVKAVAKGQSPYKPTHIKTSNVTIESWVNGNAPIPDEFLQICGAPRLREIVSEAKRQRSESSLTGPVVYAVTLGIGLAGLKLIAPAAFAVAVGYGITAIKVVSGSLTISASARMASLFVKTKQYDDGTVVVEETNN